MNIDKKEGGNTSLSSASDSTNVIKPTAEVGSERGMAAQDFELETLTGEQVRLYENDGKPTLINFWASWCPPCKIEMPYLQDAYDKYGEDINFMMVDLTFNDNFDNMTSYIEESGYTFPIPLDMTGDVTQAYQTLVIPTTFIVDSEGIITHKVQGSMTEDYIQKMMKEATNSQ